MVVSNKLLSGASDSSSLTYATISRAPSSFEPPAISRSSSTVSSGSISDALADAVANVLLAGGSYSNGAGYTAAAMNTIDLDVILRTPKLLQAFRILADSTVEHIDFLLDKLKLDNDFRCKLSFSTAD